MQGLLFVPQRKLDEWLEAGEADFTAEGLHLAAEAPIRLSPALRFLSSIEGEDAAALVGKVRSEASLRELGADCCGDSVVLGEVVYCVEPGFLAFLPVPGGMGAPADRVAESSDGSTGRAGEPGGTGSTSHR